MSTFCVNERCPVPSWNTGKQLDVGVLSIHDICTLSGRELAQGKGWLFLPLFAESLAYPMQGTVHMLASHAAKKHQRLLLSRKSSGK